MTKADPLGVGLSLCNLDAPKARPGEPGEAEQSGFGCLFLFLLVLLLFDAELGLVVVSFFNLTFGHDAPLFLRESVECNGESSCRGNFLLRTALGR